MNPTPFTVEEENLICVFAANSRAALSDGIRAALPDFDEREMREIAASVLDKLDAMSDEEFSALMLVPAFSAEETEG
jgi:BMFP domain-containing protein YqiC